MSEVMPRPEQQVRRLITAIVLAVDVVALLLAVMQAHGSLRFVVSLAFGLLVPGWSVVGFLRIKDVALLVSLTIAVSLAIELIVGEIMLGRWWHLQLAEMGLAAACAFLLVTLLRAQRRTSERVQ
jgi:uncharacterized membrane protein